MSCSRLGPLSAVNVWPREVICLAILYGLKAIKETRAQGSQRSNDAWRPSLQETSVVFPFFMASLAFVRKAGVQEHPESQRGGERKGEPESAVHLLCSHYLAQAMRFMFTEEELSLLDGLPGEEEDSEALWNKSRSSSYIDHECILKRLEELPTLYSQS